MAAVKESKTDHPVLKASKTVAGVQEEEKKPQEEQKSSPVNLKKVNQTAANKSQLLKKRKPKQKIEKIILNSES